MRRMLATEVHRRFISDCNGCDPRPGGHDLHSRAAPSGSELFSCRGAAVRAVLCWLRLQRFPSRRRPPGFWVVLQENGPEFDVLPGFWAVVSVPRCDSRRRLRYNPRSEAFTSLVPRSAAYETAQNSARAFRRPAHPGHRLAYETAQNFTRALAKVANSPQSTAYETAQDFARAFGRRALDEHRAAYETAQNFARELVARFFSVSRQICTHHRYVPPTSGTCRATGCRCWRRGGSRCRWAHRRVARSLVRRRNPAGQARGWRHRVASRR